MDFVRTDRTEIGRILGNWVANGCTLEPRFGTSWSVDIKPCACDTIDGCYSVATGDVVAESDRCGCIRCLRDRDDRIAGIPTELVWMITCPTCGNKRCPHASYHGFQCAGSNEPGQAGSVYA